MKKFISVSFVFVVAFVFSPSALAKTRVVSIDVSGTATEKSGFIATYDLYTGIPHAATKAMKAAAKKAREDARSQCDELGGKLRETLSSRSAPATWIQIDKKEFEGSMEFKIDCVVREAPEKDPSVTDKNGLKPDEVLIDGQIYIKKKATVSEAQ